MRKSLESSLSLVKVLVSCPSRHPPPPCPVVLVFPVLGGGPPPPPAPPDPPTVAMFMLAIAVTGVGGLTLIAICGSRDDSLAGVLSSGLPSLIWTAYWCSSFHS